MIVIDYSYLTAPEKRFETESDSVVIGRPSRDWAVDLDLNPDSTVSRRHARVTYETDGYYIEDFNSLGGTWVNGQKIANKLRIEPGDRIKVGQTELVFRITTPPAHIDMVEDVTRPIFVDKDGDPFETGALTSTVRANESPSNLLMGDKPGPASLEEAVRRRLTAFYDLGTALGSIEGVEPLLRTVIEHLCKVIPGAQRGAVLLKDGRKLVPKAHIPDKTGLSISVHLARLAIEQQEAFTWRRGDADQNTPLTHSLVSHGTTCAMYAPMIWQEETLGIVYVDNYLVGDAFDDDDLHLLMAMASQAAMFVKNHALQEDLRHQEVVRSNLLRQFSPQVAEHMQGMLRDRGHLGLGGERVEPVTILNADVRGFTALSAKMDPARVMEMLNKLFGVCIPIIFKFNGTVDKYIGDGFLAVFGSPDPDPDGKQWENAVRAALEIQGAVRRISRRWQTFNYPAFRIGIGIHTGAVLQGFLGSDEQMEYTVIGDTVNRASRYCDGADAGEVIISPAVFRRVSSLIEISPKNVTPKHPDTEADLEAYVVKGFSTKILDPS
jgi:adenylate cyclase